MRNDRFDNFNRQRDIPHVQADKPNAGRPQQNGDKFYSRQTDQVDAGPGTSDYRGRA